MLRSHSPPAPSAHQAGFQYPQDHAQSPSNWPATRRSSDHSPCPRGHGTRHRPDRSLSRQRLGGSSRRSPNAVELRPARTSLGSASPSVAARSASASSSSRSPHRRRQDDLRMSAASSYLRPTVQVAVRLLSMCTDRCAPTTWTRSTRHHSARRLIFVCNPSDHVHRRRPGRADPLHPAVPPHVLITIDEAYVEYIHDGMAAELQTVHAQRRRHRPADPSKAYRLSGLGVGLGDRPAGRGRRARPGTSSRHVIEPCPGRRHRLAGRRRAALGPTRSLQRNAAGSAPSSTTPGSRCSRRTPAFVSHTAGTSRTGLRGASSRCAHRRSTRTAPTVYQVTVGAGRRTTPC